jgi:uncharacterized protein YdhG (YjbR/CyaY superfamily)
VTGDEKLRKELSKYEGPKGSLKFPLDKPIPYSLIRKIVMVRVEENLEQEEAKRKNK